MEKLGLCINDKQIKEGLASANWPGRLQKATWENHPLILDGAHNPHAIEQLAKERSSWSNQDELIHWIIGIQIQKDAPKMLRTLLKKNDIAWIVPIKNHKSWEKEQLCSACPELSHQLYTEKGVIRVLKILSSENKWPSPAPVITGSLYLIAELLSNLQNPKKN